MALPLASSQETGQVSLSFSIKVLSTTINLAILRGDIPKVLGAHSKAIIVTNRAAQDTSFKTRNRKPRPPLNHVTDYS